VNDAKRPDWRQWLATARHPARRDGAIAVVSFVPVCVIALVLALFHRLDATAVTILASASVGLPVTWLTWATFRNASRSETPSAGPGSIVGSDRYTKVIEQLGSDKLDVRIGGIYALERIARDSARDHPTVMEVLTAFIREHSREPWPLPGPDGAEPERPTRPDVQAALTVVGRRDAKRDIRPVDLTGTVLRGTNLRGADLTYAILRGTNLRGADLTYTTLSGADLIGADLTRATLTEANLSGADLGGATLTYATLGGATLTGAMLGAADLTGAYLVRADLTRATLTGAILADANLGGARWPGDVQVPIGWKRDTRSGLLEREQHAHPS
jgi:hypothetical protein